MYNNSIWASLTFSFEHVKFSKTHYLKIFREQKNSPLHELHMANFSMFFYALILVYEITDHL